MCWSQCRFSLFAPQTFPNMPAKKPGHPAAKPESSASLPVADILDESTEESETEDEEPAAAPAHTPAPRRSTRVASQPDVKGLTDKLRSTTLKAKEPSKYFNPLPTPPAPVRPAPLLFVWGAGNDGQFGMGPDAVGQYEKPQRNTLVEKMIADGKFGKKGAGIERLAAGGMSSLFIDEQGRVSLWFLVCTRRHVF